MCGIAGLIYYTQEQYQHLGSDLISLIEPLESRGPDSGGIAFYPEPVTTGQVKLLVQGRKTAQADLESWIGQYASVVAAEATAQGYKFILDLTDSGGFDLQQFKPVWQEEFPDIHWLSIGQSLEIYKGVGRISSLADKYNLHKFVGSHGIAHTRMATESAVDLDRCHPFTTTYDLSLVHNGQLSNYYKLRFELERAGMVFTTDNDSEAIAHYIYYQLLQDKSLDTALHQLLDDVDGTYTFLVATTEKMALVVDKFAAKPAVIYESDKMVAIASEYRALLNLTDFDPNATIRELDAGEISIWSVVSRDVSRSQSKGAVNEPRFAGDRPISDLLKVVK